MITLVGTEGLREPRNLKEALAQQEASQWQQAMEIEINQLRDLGVFKLVELPHDRQAIGCQWIYRAKENAEGIVTKLKARLVALGNRQVAGLDYFETRSPVVRTDSI